MFGIGFSEILTVFLVGLILCKPKNFPLVIKYVRLYYASFIKIRYKIAQLLEDININEICSNSPEKKTTYIIGNDGNLHESYDTKDIIIKEKN
ncbi:MAG: hypothetical protein sL5_00320 [Candidatus Mesenet longicola]|uniref:Sec-independent protein translocase protein TatB n=1 Tax=Candidatus Mesenet longicola TaxID=1892558 RepID=A0A8J3HU17_9RICK|nr:MAG: hypothetical protein sGL2_00850 [Candidatus Mesenet longicola]GHM59039.1 MAG: hypothetical protein sL5_00320 [Candidatus Mesenet longicola]